MKITISILTLGLIICCSSPPKNIGKNEPCGLPIPINSYDSLISSYLFLLENPEMKKNKSLTQGNYIDLFRLTNSIFLHRHDTIPDIINPLYDRLDSIFHENFLQQGLKSLNQSIEDGMVSVSYDHGIYLGPAGGNDSIFCNSFYRIIP